MKHLFTFFLLVSSNSYATSSNDFTSLFIENYVSAPASPKPRIEPSSSEIGRPALEVLNQNPASKDHLYGYLDTHCTEKDLHTIYHAGITLMSLPEPIMGSRCTLYYQRYIDFRALDLFHFVYQRREKPDPWLSFYYAFTLLLFKDRARKRYEIANPIWESFLVYDRWIRFITSEFEHKLIVEDELEFAAEYPDDTPLVRFEPSLKTVCYEMGEFESKLTSYENAHRDYYACLSLSMLSASDEEQKLILRNIKNYHVPSDLDDEAQEVTPKKKNGFTDWLESMAPTFAAVGLLTGSFIVLDNYTGQPFNGQ